MWAKGGPVFTFNLPEGVDRPPAPRQLRHWQQGFRNLFRVRGYN